MNPIDPKDRVDTIQLEFPDSLGDSLAALSKDPTNTQLKQNVLQRIRAQRVENVLGFIGGIQLTNKVLIQLLNEYAWPYNMMLLNIEAIQYIDKHAESTLARAINIELPKFTEGRITFFNLLGNLQKNIQESEGITTAPKEISGQA